MGEAGAAGENQKYLTPTLLIRALPGEPASIYIKPRLLKMFGLIASQQK